MTATFGLAASSRLGRFLEIAGWVAAAVMVALFVTQLIGWTGHRYIAVLQSLTPYVLGLAFPLAAAAVVTQRWTLGAVAGAVSIGLVVLAWPLLHPPTQAAPAAGVTPLRVFHANVLYTNTRYDEMATTIAAIDADVLVFSEYTPAAADAFADSALAGEYPYRVEHPRRSARGGAIWSRYPITELDAPPTKAMSPLVRVESPQPILVYAVHTTSPIVSMTDWTNELRQLQSAPASDDEPLVAIGDYNAAFWHPEFRELLGLGWRDAHQVLGRPFSSSWPDDVHPLPNFVRIDHALLNARAVATAVDDVRIPGSDHVGLVVSVVPAA